MLTYNLGNFLRRLALPTSVKQWSLTTLRDKLIKIGAKVVHHARYVSFQLAEVAVSRVGPVANFGTWPRKGFSPHHARTAAGPAVVPQNVPPALAVGETNEPDLKLCEGLPPE